jgi:hypothetical protein
LYQTPSLDKPPAATSRYNAPLYIVHLEILFPLAETNFYGIFCNCMIEVRHLSGDQYEVRVTGEIPTTHQVTLKEADRVRLGGTDVPGDALIAESFRFLLEREPNTSILRTFDLPVIGTYFPEYERDIRKRVAQR